MAVTAFAFLVQEVRWHKVLQMEVESHTNLEKSKNYHPHKENKINVKLLED
jgi:hypothetical protein